MSFVSNSRAPNMREEDKPELEDEDVAVDLRRRRRSRWRQLQKAGRVLLAAEAGPGVLRWLFRRRVQVAPPPRAARGLVRLAVQPIQVADAAAALLVAEGLVHRGVRHELSVSITRSQPP
eukprot:CAMPEP_0179003750 /NCGR_PEP_ID=MMETSP0795-20121207/12881_1 /TAXON_ID=88552 /ORGANISM="Amoebophrya sp., Strain Ameob2" /LENGTH=119 /DNA_ID=CAMNT_0020697853 /DNA_START=407 /DNA_END=762 /DNA_ORIENTATION=-